MGLPHSPGGVTERNNSLRWRILLVTRRRLPKVPPPPPPGRRGGQGGPPPPERRGTRSSGARKYTTVEDLARYSVDCRRGGQGVAERQNPLRRGMSLGYSERSRKNRRIRGFRYLAVTFVICVPLQPLSAVMPGFACSTGDEQPGDSFTAQALKHNRPYNG